ncbi:chromosome partitioning protein ParA [Shewanella colwelliana]|uniref:Chromosome partitioning protein ParA n=1 Tax=Shewanella colwelliana TaxID=23 RepID=A0ABQ4P0F2_SHECO|nr:AAA family ATPase [Shewanella colwelliana]GIU40984.1 chromosome partitioning protein ParA [Shewanella colwelliana]
MNIDGFHTTAGFAKRALEQLTQREIDNQCEFGLDTYYQRYSKSFVSRLPGMSRAIVDKAMTEMENDGYVFGKKLSGKTELYDLTIEQIVDIYAHRKIPKFRDNISEVIVMYLSNLKGGVSKTVSAATLAHGLRTHPMLIQHDIRVLLIDIDPQASSTMFMKHDLAIADMTTTSVQSMLQNPSREELLSEFIYETKVPGVYILPCTIADGFIASDWHNLCEQHLPDQNPYMILRENIIEKIKHDFDFCLLDTGPHLDPLLMNSIVAADVLATPLPPAQVDLHSTLQYTSRLPAILTNLEQRGVSRLPRHHLAFMTKMSKSSQDQDALAVAKAVFREELVDTTLPNLSAFQRCGETFDTVLTANPDYYNGDKRALSSAKKAVEDFTFSVFHHVSSYLKVNHNA